MFYSHNLLAKKGSLGKVWCAAHIHRSLKKSDVTSINVPSTVDHILQPPVPIALRISGHLLVGISRIYSMQVDYLRKDCDSAFNTLHKTFGAHKSHLLEEEEAATRAEFDDITLPATFELDAIILNDDNLRINGAGDNHIGSPEHITLPEQIPSGRDGYITISLSEGNHGDSFNYEDAPLSGFTPMDEDVDQSPLRIASPVSAITRADNIQHFMELEDQLPPMEESPEYMREAVHVDDLRPLPAEQNIAFEPDHEGFEHRVPNEIEIPNSPLVPELVVSENQSLPSHPNEGIPFFTAESDQARETSDLHLSLGHESPPELAMRSTPPAPSPAPAQLRGRKRKRTQLYDEVIVLSNDVMKQWRDSTSNIVRKRKCGPCSPLDVQKFKIRATKENIFREPSLTGLCPELSDMYKEDYISSRPHLLKTPEVPASMEPSISRNPPPMNEPMSDNDMEIEQLRRHESPIRGDYEPIFTGSPSRIVASSDIRDEFTTPASPLISLGSRSGPELRTNVESGIPSTPGPIASTETTFALNAETPVTFSRSPLGTENAGLSDIQNEADVEENNELDFLTSEETTPDTTTFQDTDATFSGTTRYRKVAKFMKEKSAATPTSEDAQGNLVLNKLLEGKKRKICARMFFETLVLKNNGYLDVEQEKPYGDISLRLTPKLLKLQI